MLQVVDLLKRFKSGPRAITAVDRLSFTVAAGEVYGLLGPNGAGKTTTLRMIATLIEPDEGTVTIDGVDRRRDPLGARRKLAYVPAEAGLPDRLSPREVVRLFLLDRLGAAAYADSACAELSTGMKRRVVLARALVHGPSVLLLDEPTDGLDVGGRRDVLRLVREQAAAGRAVVLSSHIMGEVERVVDRVGFVGGGRLVDEGTVAEVIARAGTTNLDDAFVRVLGEPAG